MNKSIVLAALIAAAALAACGKKKKPLLLPLLLLLWKLLLLLLTHLLLPLLLLTHPLPSNSGCISPALSSGKRTKKPALAGFFMGARKACQRSSAASSFRIFWAFSESSVLPSPLSTRTKVAPSLASRLTR